MVGRLVAGKYRIESRLGAGGMGAIFRATQRYGEQDLGPVVVKFLIGEHAQDPERRARFVKEARAARELRSPHVVKVFDFGEDEDGTPYLVMELLEGKSLFAVLQEGGPLPVQRALRIGMQVAEAMMECHERGILHRDLKPDNLLLLGSRAGDFVKIVDFGIARVPVGPAVQQAQSAVSSVVIGTPRYMAPEQITGQPIDGRMDIFALGVILFEAMCGCPPIPLREGDNEMAYVALNLSERPRKVSDLLMGVPPELDALIDRMMAKRPEDRPRTMAEVLVALEQLMQLPQLRHEPQDPEREALRQSAAHLLVPRPGPVTLTPAQVRRSLMALMGRRRYLVPALVGAVVGLALLVGWLLTSPRLELPSPQATPGPIPAAGSTAAPAASGAPPAQAGMHANQPPPPAASPPAPTPGLPSVGRGQARMRPGASPAGRVSSAARRDR